MAPKTTKKITPKSAPTTTRKSINGPGTKSTRQHQPDELTDDPIRNRHTASQRLSDFEDEDTDDVLFEEEERYEVEEEGIDDEQEEDDRDFDDDEESDDFDEDEEYDEDKD